MKRLILLFLLLAVPGWALRTNLGVQSNIDTIFVQKDSGDVDVVFSVGTTTRSGTSATVFSVTWTAGSIFNDAGRAGADFRIESDTEDSAFVVDAGGDSVKIGVTLNARGALHLAALRDTVGAIITDSASSATVDSSSINAITSTTQTLFGDGNSANPAITNLGDLNTGIYFSGADAMDLVAGGKRGLKIQRAATLDCVTVMAPVFSLPNTAYIGGLTLKGSSATKKLTLTGGALVIDAGEGAGYFDSTIVIKVGNTYRMEYGADNSGNGKMQTRGTGASMYIAPDSGTVIMGSTASKVLPKSDNTVDLGSAAASWDTLWIHVNAVVADIPYLDARDDVADIEAIKPSARLHPITGYPLVDDRTLPSVITINWGEDGTHPKIGADGDTLRWASHRKGDRMWRPDSTCFVDPLAAIGQLQGAVRRLSARNRTLVDRVDSLKAVTATLDPIVQGQQVAILELLERTDDASFGGVSIGQVVAGLVAAVAGLTAWITTLKKQINALEERIAKLEGVAPTPPNPEA